MTAATCDSVDRGIEKLRAGQLGKMNELVSNFLNFPANLLPGFHPQLDDLAGVPLKNAKNRIARLVNRFCFGPNRSEQARARTAAMRSGKRFMVFVFCPRTARFASEYLWQGAFGAFKLHA